MKEKIKKLGTGSVFLLSVLCFSAAFFAGGIVKYVKILIDEKNNIEE